MTVSDDERFRNVRVKQKGVEMGQCAMKHAQKSTVAALSVPIGNGSKVEIVVPVLLSVAGLKEYGQSIFANGGAEADGVFALGVFGGKALDKGVV